MIGVWTVFEKIVISLYDTNVIMLHEILVSVSAGRWHCQNLIIPYEIILCVFMLIVNTIVEMLKKLHLSVIVPRTKSSFC